MKTFRAIPNPPTQFEKDLQKSIQEAAMAEEPYYQLQLRTSEPTTILPRMLVYADGVGFDPGSGEGLYRRNNANSAWVFLG